MSFVSVIIPTYNRQGTVLRAVDSVLRQSHRAFELLVVDDGSTDNTREWLALYNDPRLRYHCIPHAGVATARNAGAKEASGEWLCFLDSDDLWHKNKLAEQSRFHTAYPHFLLSQTDDVWIRNSERVNKMKKHSVRAGNLFRQSLRLCLICCSSVMIQKELFMATGGFDETLPTCEDYDLWLRLLSKHEVGFINKELVTKFGGHQDQLSKSFPVMDRYRIYALEKLLKRDDLSPEQRCWAEEELCYKQDIINRRAVS